MTCQEELDLRRAIRALTDKWYDKIMELSPRSSFDRADMLHELRALLD